MTCEILIGTSGYHYKHGQGPFYPKKISPEEMLGFYSRNFDSVELNNSFIVFLHKTPLTLARIDASELRFCGQSQPLPDPSEEAQRSRERFAEAPSSSIQAISQTRTDPFPTPA
jgi:hypothetical protein